MIASLTGTLHAAEPTYLILSVGGVGYKCYAPLAAIEAARAKDGRGEPITLFTHLAVREDALDLYGFETREEVAFFELLIGISGIGPRSALAIMNMGDLGALKSAAAAGDTAYLTRVSGIGKKNAQKIVLELKDKLAGEIGEHASGGDIEVLDALRAMGYTDAEARQALKGLDPDVQSVNGRIREALKQLGS